MPSVRCTAPMRESTRTRGTIVHPLRLRRRQPLSRQLRTHSVALISLVLAIVSLGYNTWRNETTELQRNWRQASFQVMIEVGKLNEVVLYRRYFQANVVGSGVTDPSAHPIDAIENARTWVAGWGSVATIRDLTSLMPAPLPERGRALFATWEAQAGALDSTDPQRRDRASRALLAEIERLRGALITLIDRLR